MYIKARLQPRGHVGFLVPAIDFCFEQAQFVLGDAILFAQALRIVVATLRIGELGTRLPG